MKNTNNNNNQKKKNNGIQNPVNTLYGKILIWTLIIIMVGGSLVGLIATLLQL